MPGVAIVDKAAPLPLPPNLPNPADVTLLAPEFLNQAQDFLEQLGALAGALVPPVIEPAFPEVTQAPTLGTATLPTLQDWTWDSVDKPAAFGETLTIDDILPDPFAEDPPDMNWGTAPAVFSETAPDAPSVQLSFDFPTLSYTLPEPPDLFSLNTVTYAGLDMPTLDAEAPTLTAVEPQIVAYGPETLYTSDELTLLQTTLAYRIETGGTGLPPEVEEAIWNRAREREFRAQATALDDLDRMESMGFALPPGVWVDARLKVQTDLANTTIGLSRDIAIKQAELELSNALDAIKQLNALESKLIDQWNNYNQRAFETAKYMTQSNIEVYNAQVRAYGVLMDAYRARVQVYEALIRGEQAKVEVYKAQIDAEKSKADMNRVLVDQYKVQNDVALANIEIYKAELGAIQTRADIEKTKVMVYGEQIKGFVGKINAYTAQVEGYTATVKAEATKQEAYRSQVDAYNARVQAALGITNANIDAFKARIAAKNLEYDAYKAEVSAQSEYARAISAQNSALVDTYRSQSQAIASYNEVLTKQWQAQIDIAERIAEVGVKAAEANAQLILSARQMAIEAAKVGAQVSAQLGAAALNAVHYSESLSWSSSVSGSMSISNSDSDSTSENTNRNLSV